MVPFYALMARGGDRRFKDVHRFGEMRIRNGDGCQETNHVAVDPAGEEQKPRASAPQADPAGEIPVSGSLVPGLANLHRHHEARPPDVDNLGRGGANRLQALLSRRLPNSFARAQRSSSSITSSTAFAAAIPKGLPA